MEILVNNGIVSFIAYLMIFITTSQNVLAIKKKRIILTIKECQYNPSLYFRILPLFVLLCFHECYPFYQVYFSLFAIIYIMNYNIENEVVK